MTRSDALVIIFWSIVGALAGSSLGQDSKNLFSGSVTLQETYDNNILEYSPEDIADLKTGNRADKFSVSKEYDFITLLRGRFEYSPEFFAGNPSTLAVKGGFSYFALNGIENYGYVGAEAEQTFLRKNSVALKYIFVPTYYLRNLSYRDLSVAPPPLVYSEARYHKNELSARLQRKFASKFTASLSYRFAMSSYNRELTERDHKDHTVGADLTWRPARSFRLGLGYDLCLSTAQGRAMSDTLTDVSYRSHTVVLDPAFLLKPRLHVPLEVRPHVAYSRQIYLSTRDPQNQRYGDWYHFGRIDDLIEASCALSFQVSRIFSIDAAYAYRQNFASVYPEFNSFSDQAVRVGVTAGF